MDACMEKKRKSLGKTRRGEGLYIQVLGIWEESARGKKPRKEPGRAITVSCQSVNINQSQTPMLLLWTYKQERTLFLTHLGHIKTVPDVRTMA